MTIKEHRTQALALFILCMLCILLMAISFWNRGLKSDVQFGFWPLFFLILSLLGGSFFLIMHLKLTDSNKVNSLIQDKVNAERTKLLSELENKKVETSDDTKKNVVEAHKIVPTGSFKSEEAFAKKLLLNLSKELQASIGIYYHLYGKSKNYRFLTGFGLPADTSPPDIKNGENLNGQVAKSKQIMILENIPENYFTIESGLGNSKPKNIVIAPIVHNNKTIAIVEIATFIETDTQFEKILGEVCTLAAKKIEQINKL